MHWTIKKASSHKKYSFTLFFLLILSLSLLPFEIFSYLDNQKNNTQQISSDTGSTGGGSESVVLCKDNGGIDISALTNGYQAPICVTTTPTSQNYESGLFSSTKARSTPNPYQNGKYYDVYKCVNPNTYDFAPKDGLSDVCNKYPWVQDASGTLPTPPAGQNCKDPTPYWDGTTCTFRPDACNNVGPSGKNNTCQSTACDSAHSPDTLASKAEANLACSSTYGSAKGYCCLQDSSSTPTPPIGGPITTLTPTNPPTSTPPATGGTGRENDHCYHGDDDCAPQFKCTANPGTATSYCVYRSPNDPSGDPYCNVNSYHCEGDASDPTSHTKCDSGSLASPLGHNYSCQKSGMGSICCTGSATTKSASKISSNSSSQDIKLCSSNSYCVVNHLGTGCVYTNNQSLGICR